MKRTKPLIALAATLMRAPGDQHWGYDLQSAAGIRSGTLYPLLKRLLADGWLQDGWEDAAVAAEEGRPPRRYYRLTDLGARELGALQVRSPEPAGPTHGIREGCAG